MTKKHFIALADAIREFNNSGLEDTYFMPDQIDKLADFCQSQNPRFNSARWLGYIRGENGKNGGKVKSVAN